MPLVALLLASLPMQSPAHVKTQLQARYQELETYLAAKKWDRMEAMLTPDFKAVRAGAAPSDRKGVVQMFKAQTAAMSHVSWKRHIEKLSLHNGVAQVHVTGKIDAVIHANDGKTHKLHLDAASVDDWVQLHHVWMLKRTQISSTKVTVDGKPMSGMG